MFTIDTSKIQRFAISSFGALILSTACVVGAVGPAKAATANAPLTVGDWQADVEQQIDRVLRVPDRSLGGRDHAVTTVSVRFDANGDFAGASVAKSSRIGAVDREALRVARNISYPALPQGLRGRPQTIAMQLYFGQAGDPAAQAKQEARAKTMAEMAKGDRKIDSVQVAALPAG